MHTEILLSRGETVTSFEVPEATQVKIVWPEPKKLTIAVPLGQSAEVIKENFENVLHPDLVEHLVSVWPNSKDLKAAGKPVLVSSWDDVQIEVVPQKAPKTQAEIDLDRPRVTIQMGLRVDEFTENCKKHLKPEVLEHVIRLWSDPDYCRTVLPVGRNLLIRGCALA
jgi:hypothetical protein